MFVVQNRETKLYYGSCSTTGGTVWLNDINHRMVEKRINPQGFKNDDFSFAKWYHWIFKYKIIEINE